MDVNAADDVLLSPAYAERMRKEKEDERDGDFRSECSAALTTTRADVPDVIPFVEVIDLNNDERDELSENPSVSAVLVGIKGTF